MKTTEIKPIFVDRCCGLADYAALELDEMLVHSIFKTIQGEGPYAGQTATFIRLAGCNFGGKSEPIVKDADGKIIRGGGGCSFCFAKRHGVYPNVLDSKGAPISMDKLKEGDKILTQDIITKQIKQTIVTKVIKRYSDNICSFCLDSGEDHSYYITGEHPIFYGNNWVPVENIPEGAEIDVISNRSIQYNLLSSNQISSMLLQNLNELNVKKTKVTKNVRKKDKKKVINIETEDHSYLVSGQHSSFLVHNCDTRFYYHEGKIYKIPDLINEIKTKYFTEEELKQNPLVIVTGGEPTLQLHLVNLIKELNNNGINTQIETNGAFLKILFDRGYPDTEVMINDKKLYNTIVCSPKLGSGIRYNEKQFYSKNDEVLKRIDHFKFVVEDPEENEGTPYSNLPNYINIFKKYHPTDHVWVSGINVYKRPTSIAEGEAPCLFQSVPCVEGYDKKKGPLYDLNSCYKNYKYAAKIALENGYRLNFQLHLLFGLF